MSTSSLDRDSRPCSGNSSYSLPATTNNVTLRRTGSTSSSHSPAPLTLEDIAVMLKRCESKLDTVTELQGKLANLVTRMDTLEERISKVCNVTDVLQPDFNNVKDRIMRLETDFQALTPGGAAATDATSEAIVHQEKLSDAVIRGIPFVQSVTPSTICDVVCSLVGHKQSPYVSSTFLKPRLNPGNGKSPSSYPVLIQFSGKREASMFLALARVARKRGLLKLAKLGLGFDGDDGADFYVHENVTPRVNTLLIAALQMKRNRKMKAAFTTNGVLRVKNLADELVTITSADDLAKLDLDPDAHPATAKLH